MRRGCGATASASRGVSKGVSREICSPSTLLKNAPSVFTITTLPKRLLRRDVERDALGPAERCDWSTQALVWRTLCGARWRRYGRGDDSENKRRRGSTLWQSVVENVRMPIDFDKWSVHTQREKAPERGFFAAHAPSGPVPGASAALPAPLTSPLLDRNKRTIIYTTRLINERIKRKKETCSPFYFFILNA